MTDAEMDREQRLQIEKLINETTLLQKDIGKHTHKTYMPLAVAAISFMGIVCGILGAIIIKVWFTVPVQ